MSEVKSIINSLNIHPDEQPLFFGKSLGLQRYDRIRYPKLFQYFDKQLLLFWRPEEQPISKDAGDFKKLSKHEQKLFTYNLGFQILLDSVQSRGLSNLAEYCSNSEVELFIQWWAAFEGLHSYSYTYIVKNVYPDPNKILDELAQNEEILGRAYGVTKYYDEMINQFDSSDSIHDKKKALYLTIVSIQILEAVRFYVSFACSYYFATKQKMIGNSKIIQLINRDENLHLGFTKELINILRTREDEGFVEVVKECEPLVQQMWKDAAEEEMKWADYLFSDGEIIGLNATILSTYMKYLVNDRMTLCGYQPIFEPTANPIQWIDAFIDSTEVQNAPQEAENTSYLANAVSGEMSEEDFEDLAIE
jgi:ribonucleoside-diphosphate reductase beta chain